YLNLRKRVFFSFSLFFRFKNTENNRIKKDCLKIGSLSKVWLVRADYLFTIIKSDLLFLACCASVQLLPQLSIGSSSPLPTPLMRSSSMPLEITYCTVDCALRSDNLRL